MPVRETYSRMLSFAGQIGHIAGRILYPPKCLKCGAYIAPDKVTEREITSCFCADCMESRALERIKSPYCSRCGLPFRGTGKGNACENCLKDPMVIGKVRAAVKYKGIIKEALPLFKYKSKLSLARIFEYLMFEAFIRHFKDSDIDLVMPVPLHLKKLKTRGFNQSYLLIRNFEKLYNVYSGSPAAWSIDISSLKRIRHTEPQTGLEIKERKKNLKKAFRVVSAQAIENRHILLIDDVYTTGATCGEAAEELLESGAQKVDSLVLARA